MRRHLLYAILACSLVSCTKAVNVPPSAPEALPVYIPIVKPCEVAKVPKSPLPSDDVVVPDDIFEAVKLALSDRAVALSDREKLAAANDDPCPPL